MRTSILVISLVLAVLSGQTRAQQEQAEDNQGPPLRGSDRDVAAGRRALKEWWTPASRTRDERLQWWRDARFGCFIHWGVYADPAGEFEGKRSGSYSEHIMRSNQIPLKVYKEKIVANFNAEKFDANQWANLFQGAGMKYVIITAKHHDGFAMWPSDAYPYDIRQTKFQGDPMRELADACRERGLKFGFYYSHAFDWEHPDAPGNDWDYDQPGGDKKLHGQEAWYDEHPEMLERAKTYVDKKAIPQLQELIKNYQPDILWFDTSGKLPFSEQIRIVEACRRADANVVINGRAARGVGRNWGDYNNTADNPAEVRPTEGDWESIPTVNNSYGYHQFDKNFKTPEFFIQLIAKVTAKGGNTLLNCGPTGAGEIDPDTTRIFKGIGRWMKVNGESIQRAGRTPLDRQAWGDSTVKRNTLYLHVFDWPSDGQLVVGGLRGDATSAYLLADPDKEALKIRRLNDDDVVVTVPREPLDKTDTVVVLRITGDIKAKPGRLLATNVKSNCLLAFDAITKGDHLRYGDGKSARYYVAGLEKPSDSLTWPVRLNDPAKFDVTLKYSTANANQTGAYKLKVDQKILEGTVKPTKSATTMEEVKLGTVQLYPGEYEIVLQPTKVPDGGDLMNVFEINLTPAK
ncbi:MAG: alpha-L-fucosidase [Phycisphaerales bacterium]|jgi:hypothetical protein|nr:alpha-L-fucosidase [Phycisphaerales bacterium]